MLNDVPIFDRDTQTFTVYFILGSYTSRGKKYVFRKNTHLELEKI
jgi:hypothetical protein